MSLQHLKAIHYKLAYLLKSLSEEDLNKSFIHPETKDTITVKAPMASELWSVVKVLKKQLN